VQLAGIGDGTLRLELSSGWSRQGELYIAGDGLARVT